MGVQRRYVPHLKGLISAKVDLEAQGRASIFTFCHAHLKKAILHHKRAKGVYPFFHDCIYIVILRKYPLLPRSFSGNEPRGGRLFESTLFMTETNSLKIQLQIEPN